MVLAASNSFHPSAGSYSAALAADIGRSVAVAIAEDIGSGDITAQLVPAVQRSHARVISRESMVLAGQAWVAELFAQLDPTVHINWLVAEGERVAADQVFVELVGNSRSILSGERIALNYIQTLSAVATKVAGFAALIADLPTQLLDTRKTIPTLRLAQKYAVTVGGGANHRLGLYDAFLIKENHIVAAGGIGKAIARAKQIAPNKPIEIEVETFAELREAAQAGAHIVMLDEFSLADMRLAVAEIAGRCKLEASGSITAHNLRDVALTGVDYISMGTLTKDVKAIDLSMRVTHNID
jgi:nicotinate-nucleotide pyrophosphorylase (carboxylating)